MEMYFLVLSLYSDALAIIPEKYKNEQACIEAGKKYEEYGRRFKCVPAPKPTKCMSVPVGPNAKLECE